jgi:hypothetical protein
VIRKQKYKREKGEREEQSALTNVNHDKGIQEQNKQTKTE